MVAVKLDHFLINFHPTAENDGVILENRLEKIRCVVIIRACYAANTTILLARYVVVTSTLRVVEFIVFMSSLPLFYVGDIYTLRVCYAYFIMSF